MHLLRISTTLLTYLIVLASASPMPWPDDKLEEINALRAKGVSETEIAARNPQPLTSAPLVTKPLSLSFFGRRSATSMGSADVVPSSLSADRVSGTGKERSFRESVGRRGEEIARRL